MRGSRVGGCVGVRSVGCMGRGLGFRGIEVRFGSRLRRCLGEMGLGRSSCFEDLVFRIWGFGRCCFRFGLG